MRYCDLLSSFSSTIGVVSFANDILWKYRVFVIPLNSNAERTLCVSDRIPVLTDSLEKS